MTIGVDATLLAQMRADVANMLPDTCVIHAPSTGSVSGGRPVKTYAAAGTVACRVDPLKSGVALETELANREDTDLMRQLTVPHDTTLLQDYRVVHGGVTYDVIQLDYDHSWNVSVRAKIVEFKS